MIKYTQRTLRGAALKKYKHILMVCKEWVKGLSGDQWNLVETKYVTMEQLWAWYKV